MKQLILAIIFLVVAVPAYSQMGYSRVPWGSSTWTGAGRPPHWGPPQRQHARPKFRRPRPIHPIAPPGYHHRKSIKVKESGYGSGRIRSKHSLLYVHRKPGSHFRSTVKCGGKTRTTRSREGQVVIEYVSGARNCSR